MKLKKKNIIILSISLAVIVSLSIVLPIVITKLMPFELYITDIDPAEMGPVEWQEDFDYLYDFVKDNYPYLWVKERTHGLNWLDLKSEILHEILFV